MLRRPSRTLPVLALALALAPLAHAATYYVALHGNDGASCTEAQPCATMAQAATRMRAGATLKESVSCFPAT